MVPIDSGSIDFVSTVTASIDKLVMSGSPVFLAEGNKLLTSLAIIMLVIFAIKAGIAVASGHHVRFDLPGAVSFLALFVIAEAMLRFYYASLPWASSSVSSLLPDTARQYAAAIDLTALNTVADRIHAILAGVERPSFVNPVMVGIYFMVIGLLAVVQGVLFCVNIVAFIAVGIASLLGPLLVPWLIVPRLSWLFWNWLSFMLKYSFYRVIASAITFIWANVLVTFLDSSVHGDYTLTHMLLMIVPLGMLSIGMIYSVFRVGHFVSDLFQGAASAGAGMATTVAAGIARAFV